MKEQRRRLPIGVQSFASLRKENFVYVDKTRYIYELVHGSKQYFLSRPRRFGKSLFLSTLKAYWEGENELFEGLAIAELEQGKAEAWQPYPVFYFDFNGQNYQKETALEDVLDKMLERWEDEYSCEKDGTLSNRFQNLLTKARAKTGRECVVLVDEYDKPLLEVLENDALEEHNKAVFKGFFGTFKNYDEYLRFVFFTGVTKFSKVSIFSDLNQLEDISMEYSFLDSLLAVYTPEVLAGSGRDLFSLDDCLENGDLEGIRDILTALFASIPYSSSESPFEHYFEAVLYLVFTLLGKFVACEVHSSKGRADAVVETAEYVYIFEFKLDKSADEALAQIKEKEYAMPYKADKRKLFEIGVNFDSQSRSLQEWKVAE